MGGEETRGRGVRENCSQDIINERRIKTNKQSQLNTKSHPKIKSFEAIKTSFSPYNVTHFLRFTYPMKVFYFFICLFS